jgi:hypothetical protein
MKREGYEKDGECKILRPVALLSYGLSVSTFALVESLKKSGREVSDVDDIRAAVVSIFEQVRKKTGVSLKIDWLPYEGLINQSNCDLYETTFIHTMWHTVTGNGFSHLCLGENISPEQEEKSAIDFFCQLLGLGKSVMDEAYKGYTLGVGTLAIRQ